MQNFYRFFDELAGKALVDQIRSEEPDVPIVSHSQIGSWNHCQLQWHLSYIQGWTDREKKPYLILGQLGHEALAVWYRCLQAGLARDEARELVQTKLNEQVNVWAFKSDDYLPALATMSWLVLKYIDEYTPFADKDIEEIHGVEEHFIIALVSPKGRKYYLQGYVDLRAVVRGVMRIWDHKFAQQFWYPLEVQMDSQQPFYAAAWTFGSDTPVHGTDINQLKTYNYVNKDKVQADTVFRRDSEYHTKQKLNNVLIEVGRAVDDMLEFEALKKEPRRFMSRNCSRCWYQQPCYLGLQGHNMQTLLEIDFIKKSELDKGERPNEEFDVHL